jgi:hypothetical protein
MIRVGEMTSSLVYLMIPHAYRSESFLRLKNPFLHQFFP